jgi:hypothetical protein
MLERLRNRHKGDTISIVASGPSAELFKRGDVTIAVNGSAFLDYKFDYFLCGDKNAHSKDWFSVDCSYVRVIARIVASMDKILYPDNIFPKLERLAVPQHEQGKVKYLPNPIPPHITFKYRWYTEGRISRDIDYLMFSGTISCCAVQLAYIMGASAVELFGCNFHHSRRLHYFYDAADGQIGRVRPPQREVMDKSLKEVRSLGMKVSIFGPTRLTEFDRQYK